MPQQVPSQVSRASSGAPTGISAEADADAAVPEVMLAFAPLHKRAFGVATGTAGATLMALLTILRLVDWTGEGFPLGLLEQFFEGYSVSWTGVFVGAAWGFAVAFVAGWFAAFCRNLALAVSAFFIRTRAELSETRNFLDHI
jgi:hypothetical protein